MTTYFAKFKNNWKSGVTVSLVSIPLSVSLAVASQSTPIAGIITAIWAGLIASIFGGSRFNIIGPTGALSGLLAAYSITHGMGTLPMLAIISGVFILIAYVFKLEKYLVFVPASTIQGFTLGVAFIIAFNQMNFALGINNLVKHEKFIENVFESFLHIGSTSLPAFILFIGFTIGLFLLLKSVPRIPGAILLAPIGILVGYLSVIHAIPFQFDTLGTKFTDLTGRLFIPVELTIDSSLLFAGVTIALIAILETMISAKIADGMTGTKHNERKEMMGLGLANIASGLAGGLPATAALARTALNVKSKATSKMSAMISSICVGIISLVFLSYFSYIPMPVIAAILVFVSIRMVEAHHLRKMFFYDKKSLVLTFFVAFITIYEDPIMGILAGTATSLLIFVNNLSEGHFDLITNKHNKGILQRVSNKSLHTLKHNADILVYSIKGQLVYINSQSHLYRFEKQLKNYTTVILRMRELHFIDLDGVTALDEIIDMLKAQKIQVLLSSMDPEIESNIRQELKNYKTLKSQGRIFTKTEDALDFLGHIKRG